MVAIMLKTNLKKNDMIRNLLFHFNFVLESAIDCFNRFGSDSHSYQDLESKLLDSLRVLHCVSLISDDEYDLISDNIIYQRYSNICPFDIEF